MFVSGIPSLDLFIVGAWDFPSEGPTTYDGREPQSEVFDAAQLDDVDQYVLAIAVILGVLAAVALPRFMDSRVNAHKASVARADTQAQNREYLILARGQAGNEALDRNREAPDIDLVLNADAMSVMMTALSGVLWFLTTLYAIAYLETSSQSRSRFFGFFSLCVSSTIGIALAGNLITFLMFYEMLTLTTYPLVVHRGTPDSMRAGRIYIVYTIGGGIDHLFFEAALLHVCLMLFGGNKLGFEATFRVAAYGQAAGILALVPFCGTPLGILWSLLCILPPGFLSSLEIAGSFTGFCELSEKNII